MLREGKGFLLEALWMSFGGDLEESKQTLATLEEVAVAIRSRIASCEKYGCDTPSFHIWEFEAKSVSLEIGASEGPAIILNDETFV